MNEKIFQEIGLTEGEIKVYFALVKLGSTKTGPLAKESEVSSSKVYKILDRLEKKGLVGHVLKGEVKYFQALNPQRILDYVDEKQKSIEKSKENIKQMIPQIEKYMQESGNKNNAAIFEGFKGVTNFFRSMIEELNKGETYYVLGATYGEIPGLREFFYGHHERRAKKGIFLKMLANHEVKSNIEPTTKKKAEIKYLPQYLMTNMEIVFYRNKAFIILWTKEPVGFLIENEEAVEGFTSFFNAFWKIAKP